MESAFFRLHPALQHAIVHDLGWRSLRPVQDLTIEAVLDGCNAVVLAPTAGGKTEASLFPILSRILSEEPPPVAALYVCPIRALLNNQEPRVQAYARMVGLQAFKWHGDVGDYAKQRFRREPAHILMTTPESLEVMLISARTDARALFAGLSAVIVDEVHAFAGDDRGAHLMSILERITRLCGNDIQRIGLSATVGNPAELGAWLQGSSARPSRLVDPPRPPVERVLRVERCDDVHEAASGVAHIARGRKSLVFVESRARAESVAQSLSGRGVEVFVHHSSVSRADRALAEEQFTRGQNTAIVCTSTMELGIDVGDLDHVIQVDAPGTVASFLQRLGRTGRRAGARATCTFFCLTPESLLQAVAVLRLADRGIVEDVRPPKEAMHVLAHQILALVLQEGGASRHRLLPWLRAASPFAALSEADVLDLVDTMRDRDILYEADGLLSLGRHGERLYGRRNFFELYAVFTAPPLLRVLHGRTEVGHVQATFVQMHDEERGPLCFRLAAQAWQVVRADWAKGVLHVKVAEAGRVPTWLGQPTALSYGLCQEMRAVLVEGGPEAAWLSKPAAADLEATREGYRDVLDGERAPLEDQRDGVQWHTFAGGAANRLLASALEEKTHRRWTAGNLSLKAKDVGLAEARAALEALRAVPDWHEVASRAAAGQARGLVSRFQPCLPVEAERRLLAERLLDAKGAERVVRRSGPPDK